MLLMIVLLWILTVNMPVLVWGVADCKWHPQVSTCAPVPKEKSPTGDQYEQLTLELIVCLGNNGEAFRGCISDIPAYKQLCKDVSVSDAATGSSFCLPKSGAATEISVTQAQEFKGYTGCRGEASDSCDRIRKGLYNFLGCTPCGEIANAAAVVEGACLSVFGGNGTDAACVAAGDVVSQPISTAVEVPEAPPFEVAGTFETFDSLGLSGGRGGVAAAPSAAPAQAGAVPEGQVAAAPGTEALGETTGEALEGAVQRNGAPASATTVATRAAALAAASAFFLLV